MIGAATRVFCWGKGTLFPFLTSFEIVYPAQITQMRLKVVKSKKNIELMEDQPHLQYCLSPPVVPDSLILGVVCRLRAPTVDGDDDQQSDNVLHLLNYLKSCYHFSKRRYVGASN